MLAAPGESFQRHKKMPDPRSGWFVTTINAVRELMEQRLEKHSLDPETERELQMALEEIQVMWEELQGQADLLSLEHRRYQEFFEFAPDAYAITDTGSNVREANRSLADLLRAVRSEMLGRPLSRYIAEPEQAVFLSNMIGATHNAEASPRSWRSRLQPAEGPAIDALISVRAIPLRRSGVAGLCWLFRPD
jgi:PAS domain S-box-containing protein